METEIEAFVNRNLEHSGFHSFEHLIEKYDLRRKGRHRNLIILRQYLQYLMRRKYIPFEEIGRKFDQHHATVVFAVRKIENHIDCKDKFLMQIIAEHGTEFQNAK